jgi:chromatin assembly factor 1 subunit A
VATSSKAQSDFESTFRPFVLKKGMSLAPTNWFQEQERQRVKSTSSSREGCKDAPIEVKDEDEASYAQSSSWSAAMDVSKLGPNGTIRLSFNSYKYMLNCAVDLLKSFLASRPPSLHSSGRLLCARNFKAEPKYCVRSILRQLNEAEVQGDQREVRRLNLLLKNRRKIPAKVLIFTENVRPGYLGTSMSTPRDNTPKS